MEQAAKPVEHVIAAIQSLDLDPIKLKLMDPDEGQGWSREHADRMELAYRRFLTLLAKYPDETIAPSKDVDKFWHGHILDTLKYAEDCQNVFGYFLHHFPYFGMRGEEDAKNLEAASARMHEIYAREFGEPLAGGAAFCVKSDKAFCVKAEGAFCVKAADSAFCVKAADRAFCVKATDSAFCVKAADSAFCVKAADSAFCVKATDSAFCVKSRSAFCVKGKADTTTRPAMTPAS